MGFIKYAVADVLSAEMGSDTHILKSSHRAEFQYDKRPGFIYVRSRAISSRCNDNFDEFPADEIRKGYLTFVGKPVFVNHRNENHRRARGVVIDAALHEDVNSDGSDDVWVEVLMEISAQKFPKLAKAIMAGEIDRTSMGTDVSYSLCSFCGNRATTPLEYCRHIPKMKGQRITRVTASGAREEILVREICYGLKFFENSLLVEPPADPTASFLGVEPVGKVALRKSAVTLVDHSVPAVHTRPNEAFYRCNVCDRPVHMSEQGHGLPFWVHDWDSPEYASVAKMGGETKFKEHKNVSPSETKNPDRYEGVSIKQDLQGKYYVHTHRARSKGYDSPEAIPDSAITFIESTGAFEAPGDPSIRQVGDPSPRRYETCPACGHENFWMGLPGQKCINCGASLDVDPRGHPDRGWPISLLPADVRQLEQAASRHVAFDEVRAPAEVNTLREEACPVCGEDAAYDGNKCMVCGFIKPPDMFMDPDLERAQQVDLRQDQEQGEKEGGDLKCDNCGAQFQSSKEPEEDEEEEGEKKEEEKVPEEIRRSSDRITDPELLDNRLPHPQNQEEIEEHADDDTPADTDLKAGDTCPKCGKGKLQPVEKAEKPDEEVKEERDSKDTSEKPNPFEKKDDKAKRMQKEESMRPEDQMQPGQQQGGNGGQRRPILAALAEQQGRIKAQGEQIAEQNQKIAALHSALRFMVEIAGVEQHPKVAALYYTAAPDPQTNPAQPPGWGVPNTGGGEAPSESTDQARAPEGKDDPTSEGSSPVTDVSPDATTSPTSTDTSLDVGLDLNEKDVTAPVAGTESQRPLSETKIETDVRAGTPSQGGPAFPLQGPFAEQPRTSAREDEHRAERQTDSPQVHIPDRPGESRTISALRLARLRIQAGIEDVADDLALSTQIEQSDMDEEAIQAEIDTLSKVVQKSAARDREPVARNLVPTSTEGAERTTPSLAGGSGDLPAVTAAVRSENDDEFLFD